MGSSTCDNEMELSVPLCLHRRLSQFYLLGTVSLFESVAGLF